MFSFVMIEGKGGRINMCVLLDMYEERGMEKINSLYHCLLEDNRMEDIQKAMLDAGVSKKSYYESMVLEKVSV